MKKKKLQISEKEDNNTEITDVKRTKKYMHKFDNTDVCVLVTQSCLTLVTSWTVCSPSGSSVHRIFIDKTTQFLFLIN